MKFLKGFLPLIALIAFNSASCSSMLLDDTSINQDEDFEDYRQLTNNASSQQNVENTPIPVNPVDNKQKTYTVTWVNDLGAVLKVDELPFGATPVFENTNSLYKEADEDFSYTFSGWEPEIEKVTKDVTYTAKYIQESINFYTTTDYKYNGIALVGVKKIQDTVRIPSYINGLPVTQIQFTGDHSWKGISTLVVPSTVIEVGSYDINNDYEFENVILGENVEVVNSGLFTNSKTLKSITLSNKLTTITDSMFKNCTSLAEVNFNTDSHITTIAENAFEGCSSLKRLNLPSSLNNVGYGAFSFTGLEEVTFPSHCSKLGSNLFEYSKNLKKVILPTTVENFNTYCLFNECESLKEVSLPTNTTLLRTYAFKNCNSLVSLTLPNNIETIEGFSIAENDSLEHLVLPANLKTIETCAINENNNLKYLNVPKKVETIKLKGISSNDSLTKISLPRSIKTLGENALSYLNSLMVINYEGSPADFNNIDKNNKNDVINSVGINYYSYNDRAIGEDNILVVYKNEDGSIFFTDEVSRNANTDVTSYTPTKESDESNSYDFDSWVLVKTNSFGCKEYKASFKAKEREYELTFDLNNGDYYTESLTFNSKINYPEFPENGDLIFSGWDKEITNMPAEDVVITANYITRTTPGIVYTKQNGFRTYIDIDTAINRNIISINNGVFTSASDYYIGKDAKAVIVLPNTINEIGEGAFDSTKEFDEIIVQEGTTKIGASAFCLCYASKIDLPYTITEIGDRAYACSKIREFKAPELLEIFGNECFYGAEVENVDLRSDKLEYVSESCFVTCYNLKNITITNNISAIGRLAFFGCKNLETLYCEEGLRDLYDSAFYKCTKLREVTIPASITLIGEDSFSNCDSLQVVNYRGSKDQYDIVVDVAKSVREVFSNTTLTYNYTK